MSVTVQDLIDIVEKIAPHNLAESWDNVGLLIGSPKNSVHSLMVGLDPTLALLDEAIACGANLIITHHPIIFHPLKALHTDCPIGRFIQRAVGSGISVIGSHTNLDAAIHGVSDVLADKLGLKDVKPLIPHNPEEQDKPHGLGRIGVYLKPLAPEDFIHRLNKACSPPWLLEAGLRPEAVSRVAVCGGSCSDFAETAKQKDADVFITAEVKHSIACWAEDAGFWIIDGGHFATENLVIPVLQQRLEKELQAEGLKIKVRIAPQNSPLRII